MFFKAKKSVFNFILDVSIKDDNYFLQFRAILKITWLVSDPSLGFKILNTGEEFPDLDFLGDL
ncbi:hypothetical protein BpHYR1_030457 [Brachionus plicatilis]|uniref:Uncharacterized protein n=1 Tax=Brachionus plicatilis TaxID=10195 RepID=A0A3M7QU32_BRAPC|nr:hypothetical protein BpHYR1_030457 [Brachionus plicatilis]